MQIIGKYIWIVGASHGIGAALARTLAEEGAYVALSGRTESALNEVIASCKGSGHVALPMDVTDRDHVGKVFAQLTSMWPTLDMVIYCAGHYTPMKSDAIQLPEVRKMVDVNLIGAFNVLDAVIPKFINQRSGNIALVASIAGWGGVPRTLAYGATKAALIHMGQTLAIELKSKNIGVQVISPGFVKTRMTEQSTSYLPFRMAPEDAARHIVKGILKDRFDIHFPRILTWPLKLLNLLPRRAYIWVMRLVV